MGKALAKRNRLGPCKFDHGQEVALTPSEKVSPVSVSTQGGAMTWKGTYCSGITGDIVHRQPGTFTEYITGLGEWEQELINEMEILIKTNLEQVKGHQDDDTLYEELDLPAHLNTEVDLWLWTTGQHVAFQERKSFTSQ
eukprot:12266644-Ditylum_brightwellii.AAC.1